MERKDKPTRSTEFDKNDQAHEELVQEIMQDEKQKSSKRKRKEKWNDRKEQLEDSKLFKMVSERVWPMLVPFFIVMGFLVILPLLGIIMYSIISPPGSGEDLFKATIGNFVNLFTNNGIMTALGLSIFFGLIAAILCVVIGYPIAYIMASLKSKILAKNIWVLVTMPIWISMLLKVLGLQSLFYLISPTAIGMPITIIIGMIYMFLPFAITPIYDSIMSRNTDLEEAAKDLGYSQTKTFWTITLRESIPGILTGFSLVIIQASTSLVVVHYLGAGKIQLISSVIESYFVKGGEYGYGAAIALVLTIFIFILMLVIKVISSKFENKGKGRGKWKNSSKVRTSQ